MRTAQRLTVAVLASWLVPSAGAAESQRGESCELSGYAALPLEVRLLRRDGEAIARFTGRVLPVTVGGLARERLTIRTGDGRDGVRMSGFVDAGAVKLITRNQVDIVPAQVWLNPGVPVRVTEVGPRGPRVEATFTTPFTARFTARTACENIGLAAQPPEREEPLDDGAPYIVRSAVLVLYGAPAETGGPIASLRPSSTFVLWSTGRFRDFLRVRYRGAVGIDAWAKARDLQPLPRADVHRGASSDAAGLEPDPLVLEAPTGARSVLTAKPIPIRSAFSGPVIGDFEAGTLLTVLVTTEDWASVLPVPLELAPLPGQNFWVSATDLQR